MATRITVERTHTRQPSSSRSISTADERPIFTPVIASAKLPAKGAHDIAVSSEEDSWDSTDETEYTRPTSRAKKSSKIRPKIEIQTVPVVERRSSSRVSRHRIAAPEVPDAPRRQPSRQSEREYRDTQESPEHISHRHQHEREYRRRGSYDQPDGMDPYDDRRPYRQGSHPPRYTGQQWGYPSGQDAYGVYNAQPNPMPPPSQQIIPYQQYPQQPFYPPPNPMISPYPQINPMSPAYSTAGSYFSQEPYRPPQPAVPVMPYQYYPYALPFQTPMAPPTPRSEVEEDKFIKLQELLLSQENARLAREQERERAAQALYTKEAADKAAAEAVEAATKKAKADAEAVAEKKAKEAKTAHEKALAEAKEAEAAAKAETAKLKPNDDSLKAPIKFKDAVGRKFSFPWRICKTWKGMEELIQQAFLHVEDVGRHVQAGHYDLLGPNGEIILPQVWESTVEPDWQVTMHLWPMEDKKKKEEEKKAADVVIQTHSSHRQGVEYDIFGRKKMVKKRPKSMSGGMVVVPPPPPTHETHSRSLPDDGLPPPPPPAPAPPPAVPMSEAVAASGVTVVKEKRKTVQQVQVPPLTAWMTGMRVKSRR